MIQPAHIRNESVKIPGTETWGYQTLCQRIVQEATQTHSGELTCETCLKVFISRKETELTFLKNILIKRGIF